MSKTITEKDTDKKEKQELRWTLILWNDDTNSFDHVITCLIDICNHTIEQATQCSYIVHHNGKCDIKKGEFEELYHMKKLLNDRQLSVTLEN